VRILPVFALLLLGLPLLEIYFLIQVGGMIGALPTIVLVVCTSLLGAYLLRQQGLSTFTRFQQASAQGKPPVMAAIEGVIILFGGILMLIPGFLTDILGLFCLLPPTRKLLAHFMLGRFAVKTFGVPSTHTRQRSSRDAYGVDGDEAADSANSSPRPGATLEGEYIRKDDR